MFRYTITFLVIFLVINHEFAAARSVNFVPNAAPKPIKRLVEPESDTVETNFEGRYPHEEEIKDLKLL